jgi:hypothetical protein
MDETRTKYPPHYGYRGHESLRGITFPASLDDIEIPLLSMGKKPVVSWGITFDQSNDPNTWFSGPGSSDKGAYVAMRLVVNGKNYEAGKIFEPGTNPDLSDFSVDKAFEYQRGLEERITRLYGSVEEKRP